MTIRALQRRLGWKSYPSLCDRLAGRRRIGERLARKIEAATDGQISAASILGSVIEGVKANPNGGKS